LARAHRAAILSGNRVLIVAHGNSLRALDANLKPIGGRYLGDAAAIETAMEALMAQGKATPISELWALP
jgi:broad specificity phosphatase PhoE